LFTGKLDSSSLEDKKISFRIFQDLLLLFLSAFLFAISFPSFLSRWGYFPLAFFALIPLFIVVHRCSWKSCFFYGLFFGFISYSLFNFWLAKFHPLAIFIVPPIHSFYFLLLFPLLKAADSRFPRSGYILQSLLWVAYEFVKTQGFLAYAYGNLGYSQYLFLPLIAFASITGVWGVSLIVVFPSALIGHFLKGQVSLERIREYRLPVVSYLIFFIVIIFSGYFAQANTDNSQPWKVALIQQNVDPWKGGVAAYEKSLDILIRLSSEALSEEPDIIIWSETSFVPGIDWHTRYRTDQTSYILVKRLRGFLEKQEISFVIGNDDGQLIRTETGEEKRVDYNAAILFRDGKIVKTYRKVHLVPFTEYFPYKQALPGVYRWLRNADTHFWEKGREYTVFESDGVKFSTPICFEDTFGYLCRNFIRQGADVLVNMTNDSWSQSVAAEMQHMSMGVLRAVENRRSVVRATNGGITAIIDPNGKILKTIPPFVQGYLTGVVPVYKARTTFYTRWGDWFGWLSLLLSLLGTGFTLFRQLFLRLRS